MRYKRYWKIALPPSKALTAGDALRLKITQENLIQIEILPVPEFLRSNHRTEFTTQKTGWKSIPMEGTSANLKSKTVYQTGVTPVKENETPPAKVYCRMCPHSMVFRGWLIHTSVGISGARGGPLTKRSGRVA